MILEDFRKIIDELKLRPIPGKHVYVWKGDRGALQRLLGDSLAETLDISTDLDIGTGGRNSDDPVFAQAIEEALGKRLFELYSEIYKKRKQQMLVVSSASLLARYKIGLTVFYNYYVGDRTKVVFVVPKLQSLVKLNLPDYVIYEPDQTLKYLSHIGQPENIVE